MASSSTLPKASHADGSRRQIDDAVAAIGTVLRGADEAARLILATICARGHVLLEDVPGVGKTTLARTVARVLGCSFGRIQFTSDMLPSDVLGVQILDPATGALEFRRGPIFAQLILADEINRASPKTQSAMLEAMADRQVSVDDTTHDLDAPFTVLATQNPVEHHGAYPLPESQLDRFMVCLSLGYPAASEERALLFNPRGPELALDALSPVLNGESVLGIQAEVDRVRVAEPVADYLLQIVAGTRNHPDVLLGVSPRGSLAFVSLARAWAFLAGRDFVIPDDIKALVRPVMSHRLTVGGSSSMSGARTTAEAILDEIVGQIPVPR
ncbi:MAG: MoxR family ATPase [Myxococcota bacterium]